MNTRHISRSMTCSIFLGAALSASQPSAHSAPPPLALANDYEDVDIDLSRYWVSEKYDGVRAYWDGTQLLTRAGNVIHAPEWFTARWPATPLDGELWAGRGRFEAVTATVRDFEPSDEAWQNIRFMVFDLPTSAGPFDARLPQLELLLARAEIDWLKAAPHTRVIDATQLHRRLHEVTSAGGEGLMLHRGDSMYRAERSDALLKFKPYQDAEAQVIAHLPGKGKYTGMMGALLVQDANGKQFRIGTGFTDEIRRHPPPLGSWVTYSFHNVTGRGIPRFARFLRMRTP
jgi:DNA ligase-1